MKLVETLCELEDIAEWDDFAERYNMLIPSFDPEVDLNYFKDEIEAKRMFYLGGYVGKKGDPREKWERVFGAFWSRMGNEFSVCGCVAKPKSKYNADDMFNRLEHKAKSIGCTCIAFWSARKASLTFLAKHGYKLSEVTMRKQIA